MDMQASGMICTAVYFQNNGSRETSGRGIARAPIEMAELGAS